MRLVILSDLNWHAHLRSITHKEIAEFKNADLLKNRYERIARYLSIVEKENADLVLLAGDITGDGGCGHGFQNALKLLLLLLENRGIPSKFISGNHDPSEFYDDLLSFTEQLQLTEDISNKACEFNGLRILGINYDCSSSLSRLNQMTTAYEDTSFHICLAHSEIKRRLRLFHNKTQLIVTGHYDRKLMPFKQSIYIALDNDWAEVSYATADFTDNNLSQASIHIRQDPETTLSLTQSYLAKLENTIMTANGHPALDLSKIEGYADSQLTDDSGESWIYLKHLRGNNLRRAFHTLWTLKTGGVLAETDLTRSDIYKLRVTDKYKVSNTMINDYLNS